MAAVLTAAQDLWVTLNQFVVSDPLILPLLNLLAVLFAVVLGLSIGSRTVKRVRRRDSGSNHAAPQEPEVEAKPVREPRQVQRADLEEFLREHAEDAVAFLHGEKLWPEPPDSAQLRWQREILDAYVGKEVTAQLSAAAEVGQAGGLVELAQAARGAVLFFDLRGFTQATEHLGGAYVMRLLNVYLRQMAEVVSDHQGIVDKFIGDNVMATFGVLCPVPNAAQSAAACAKAMIERMVHINSQLNERGLPSLRPSVGLACGEVVSGTLGGSKRRSFTVIGACVNRAARLENATRSLEVDLLMDHASYEQLTEPPWGMKVHHRVQLQGVEEAILAWSWTRPKVTAQSS